MANTAIPLSEGKGQDGPQIRKVKLKTSKMERARPFISHEQKECLASYIKVGGMEAWTPWDSGSTTTGITPTFAQIANITVDTLLDPHILQLGTVGSRSSIKYGADTRVTLAGFDKSLYVDVANFNRYDMIMGTPFMRANKVMLDFGTNEIVVNGMRTKAKRVISNTDGHLRRQQITNKE